MSMDDYKKAEKHWNLEKINRGSKKINYIGDRRSITFKKELLKRTRPRTLWGKERKKTIT